VFETPVLSGKDSALWSAIHCPFSITQTGEYLVPLQKTTLMGESSNSTTTSA